VDLLSVLAGIRRLHDVPQLLAALGHEPRWDLAPGLRSNRKGDDHPTPVVGRTGDFPWFGISGSRPEQDARRLARRLHARGRIGGVLALDASARRLAVAVAFGGIPSLLVELDAPAPAAVASLARLAAGARPGALAFAAAAADALAGEAVGRRFFHQFRATLEQMAAGLPGPLAADDRSSLALLQLTRVLFLYFVQAKGWLAGRERFLAEQVDHCLARKRRIHRDLLRPLFFGTLNRPAAERSRTVAAFGAIPFLNGGLFEPHPLERRLRAGIPNAVWRDAFDTLFERFHFTVTEAPSGRGVAPDMLGRVFEGVMAPDARRASGTYYTPAALVRRMLDAALVAAVAGRLGCGEAVAYRRLSDPDRAVLDAVDSLTLLDPAVGSGAFLVGALERMAGIGSDSPRSLTARRRKILARCLFGVDRSAAAVRLTELRLWLAVVAGDPADTAERIRPLPNLDCLVRQGDSLFDPFASRLGPPLPDGGAAADLAMLRRRVVTAVGPAKRARVRELARAEARATDASFAAAEAALATSIAECLSEGRSLDLFGQRRGFDHRLRKRLAELRGQRRTIRQARRTLAREREIPWFHYQGHFADVFARGGFDLVVGNPPWLRAEEVPPELRHRLAGRYRWWRTSGRGYAHQPDLAVAFFERALELVAPGGIVALLVPAKLATAGYGALARHALASSTTLLSVTDLTGEADAAFDATVYPLAVITRRSSPLPNHRVRTGLPVGTGGSVRQSRLQGGGAWVLRHDRVRGILQALGREHPSLGEQISCHLGVKTGANHLFLDPPGGLEPEVLRWAVRGRDLRAFRAVPRVRLLWTHGPDGGPRRTLPVRAAAYLAPHHAALRARADCGSEPPWTLFRTRAASAPYRVVWADLARQLKAVALIEPEDGELIPLNTCYLATLDGQAQAESLAAWLNSTWIRAAARVSAVPAAGGFARYTAATMATLPLPPAVRHDPALAAIARAGRRDEPVQRHLDVLCARHLGLSPSAQSALRQLAQPRADHRR
jgi:hypothetical protein